MRKHFTKTSLTILPLVAAITFSPITASAHSKVMPDGGRFDATFYAATYPDVKAAFGTNENLLYQHYLNNGKKEGRLPYDPKETSSGSVTAKLLLITVMVCFCLCLNTSYLIGISILSR